MASRNVDSTSTTSLCPSLSTANSTYFETLASSAQAIVAGVKEPVSSSELCERDAGDVESDLEPGKVTFYLEPEEAACELGLGDVASEFEAKDAASRLAS